MIVEIFKAGTHTDSSGNTRTWTEQDLDLIAQKYQEQLKEGHQAPVVIGHPKDNHPAFGWIEEIRRVGDKLVAKISPTVNEFVEAVKKGLFKNVSISLYPDYRVRHLGFLGAVPPAVKGLKILSFNEQEEYQEYSFEFSEAEAEEQEKEESEGGEDMQELETLKQQLEEKDRLLAQLQQKIRQLEEEKKQTEVKEFAEKLEREEKITPALKQKVIDILMTAHRITFDFSEEKANNLTQQIKDFLESLPSMKLSSEIATPDKVADHREIDPEKLTGWQLIQLYKENPEEYHRIVRGLK